jgi:GMP reductase
MKYLKYSDVALVPEYSECASRSDCDTSIKLGDRKFKLPIVPANMKSVIDMPLARWMSENDYFYIMHRFDTMLLNDICIANTEKWKTISFSVGVKDSDHQAVAEVGALDLRVDFITVDIAHGHSFRMKKMIERIKESLPDTMIIAGNVATPDAVADLSAWGADIVKVGIGQGSPCTTKDKTGFTVPMFSCVKRCSNVSFNLESGFIISEASIQESFDLPQKICIIADGGVEHNGDITKALCAGATMVMAGGLFASCIDSPAGSTTINDAPHKAYFGSASAENKGSGKHIEGKLTNIPSNKMTYREKLEEVEQDLQSSISYSGGNNLDSLYNIKYIEL